MDQRNRNQFGVRVCGALLAVAVCTSVSRTAEVSATVPPSNQQYHLNFFHTHTGERLDIVYRKGDRYLPKAISKLEYYLRDYRTGKVHHFDPRLFDLLSDVTTAVGRPGGEIDVVCGYRTPQTNKYLRTHTSGVAKNSLHMQAMALDLRIPGVKTEDVREAALALHRGGVGYYPDSDFVHLDVGRVRQW